MLIIAVSFTKKKAAATKKKAAPRKKAAPKQKAAKKRKTAPKKKSRSMCLQCDARGRTAGGVADLECGSVDDLARRDL